MVDLYKNYDCDVQCTNLFETLCACLCKNAVPPGGRTGQLTILNTLSLEAILSVLDSIGRRCINHDNSHYTDGTNTTNHADDGPDVRDKDTSFHDQQTLQIPADGSVHLTHQISHYGKRTHRFRKVNLLIPYQIPRNRGQRKRNSNSSITLLTKEENNYSSKSR